MSKREDTPVEWTRSETLALAQYDCTFCYGLGTRPGRGGRTTPCNCVFRAIFRICYAKFRLFLTSEKQLSHVTLDVQHHEGGRRTVWGLKEEEFCADFCLIARRSLSLRQHRLFRFHFLLAADWKLCCAKLGLERGAYYHEVYRLEQRLGRVFRELRPYGLFPVDEYFGGTTARHRPAATPAPVERQATKLLKLLAAKGAA